MNRPASPALSRHPYPRRHRVIRPRPRHRPHHRRHRRRPAAPRRRRRAQPRQPRQDGGCRGAAPRHCAPARRPRRDRRPGRRRGAHLTGIEAFTAALPSLKPDRIAGAGGLRSRHDAMLAGKSAADYVLFGEPDRRGNRPQWGAVEDRVKWWADLVEVPCIGYAGEAGEVRLLAQAGADFVALGDWIWTHPQGAAAAVTMAASALAEPAP